VQQAILSTSGFAQVSACACPTATANIAAQAIINPHHTIVREETIEATYHNAGSSPQAQTGCAYRAASMWGDLLRPAPQPWWLQIDFAQYDGPAPTS
jgi:hypothetical protein